jgi:hypothetical protein
MHLVNSRPLRLEPFPDARPAPQYAILSHTWGRSEATFEQFRSPWLLRSNDARFHDTGTGLWKIRKACEQALADGLSHVWVDTCCIDKRSSAELSEAINSMFKWYRSARVCYAYLEDVDATADSSDADVFEALAGGKWFTRGWTLQELIAPSELVFFNRFWRKIGTKLQSSSKLAEITGVDQTILRGEAIQTPSVSQEG